MGQWYLYQNLAYASLSTETLLLSLYSLLVDRGWFNVNRMRTIYEFLPGALQSIVRTPYHALGFGDRKTEEEIEERFVEEFFQNRAEYESYREEFQSHDIADVHRAAMDRYRRMTGDSGISGVGLEIGSRYYALVRK